MPNLKISLLLIKGLFIENLHNLTLYLEEMEGENR